MARVPFWRMTQMQLMRGDRGERQWIGKSCLSRISSTRSPPSVCARGRRLWSIARLYDLDGYVLLVGVGYDKNTSLHLADARAQYPRKHDCVEYSAIMENGRRAWKEYRTLYVDGEDFVEIGAAFERECTVSTAPLGNGTIRFMRQRELVDFAVDWIEHHRGRSE